MNKYVQPMDKVPHLRLSYQLLLSFAPYDSAGEELMGIQLHEPYYGQSCM